LRASEAGFVGVRYAPCARSVAYSTRKRGEWLQKSRTGRPSGAPICIIEAMKLFNQIKVEKPLHLVRFLVKTGETVQKGAPYAVVRY